MASITALSLALKQLNRSVKRPFLATRRHCVGRHRLSSLTQETIGSSPDIESLFLRPQVQTLLKKLIGFDDMKVFEMKPSLTTKTNEYRFMTDNELKLYREMARKAAEEKLKMPPVCRPKEDNPRILAKDFEIQSYIDSKLIFVDSSAGSLDKNRLIVVRETNGVLREANREERYRMNQMFFPQEERLMETPNIFIEPHLTDVLDRREYEFVLERACLQFEPNDPMFVDTCHKTYDHISTTREFARLKSTRHFGPLCLYLAFNRKMDNLLDHMILSQAISDAEDLCRLFYLIHSADGQTLEDTDSLALIKKYIRDDSKDKSTLELSLQKYEEVQREQSSEAMST